MPSTTKTLSNTLFSFVLLGALGSTFGCDAQDETAPNSVEGSPGSSAGKSDDASGAEPDPEGCALKGQDGGCECTHAEYKDGCGQCDEDVEDCDKAVGGSQLLECAPAISAVAVACGSQGFSLLVDAASLDTMAALQDFWELLFDDDCGWAVTEASRCMYDGWLGVASVGIMWDYDYCLAQGRSGCCVADSQCGGGICGDSGVCFY